MNQNSLRNLQPFNSMDPEKHKELSARGGKRSAEVRKAKQEALKAERIRAAAELDDLERKIRLYRALCLQKWLK